MNEYVVTFPTSEQIAEDSWRVRNPSLKVNDETTMKEIANFYKSINKCGNVEVTVIELINAKGVKK